MHSTQSKFRIVRFASRQGLLLGICLALALMPPVPTDAVRTLVEYACSEHSEEQTSSSQGGEDDDVEIGKLNVMHGQRRAARKRPTPQVAFASVLQTHSSSTSALPTLPNDIPSSTLSMRNGIGAVLRC